jgi:hypothetical protein
LRGEYQLYLSLKTPHDLLPLQIQILLHYCNVELRAQEEPPKNYLNIMFDDFNNEIIKRKSQWLNQIKKQISSIYDTHPSFSERMNALGIDDFNYEIEFENQNENYKKEIDNLIDIKSKQWYEYWCDEWG